MDTVIDVPTRRRSGLRNYVIGAVFGVLAVSVALGREPRSVPPWETGADFVYPAHGRHAAGRFHQRPDGIWIESKTAPLFRFYEMGRSSSFVELFDCQRGTYVRLHRDRALVRGWQPECKYKVLCTGEWEKAGTGSS